MKKNIKIFDSDALKNIHGRVFLSITVFIVFFLLVFIQIFNVMIIQNYFSIEKKISNNHEKNKIDKGNIFDRNGVLLASTILNYSLYVKPDKIKDIKGLTKKLSKILNLPSQDLSKKLSSKRRIRIKNNISPKQHKEIINLGEIALITEVEKKRIYPLGEITSHIVGFTDLDGNGLTGIEKGLEDELNLGKDIYLSIDFRIQNVVRNELIKSIEKFSAQSAISLVMDIQTGEIISLVNYPDFDPNIHDIKMSKYEFNSATQGLYEMGSTFKPLTIAMGLEKNIINDNMKFDVSKPIKIGKYQIQDFEPYEGEISIKDVIVMSSNIGAAKIALLIGKDNQRNFFDKLGFFDKIDLEIKETIKPKEPINWKNTEIMTMGYGYGIAISPLHLCQAYASIINGNSIKPTLIKNKKTSLKKFYKKTTSNRIKNLLRSVIIENEITGKLSNIPGYELAGKTGTAEYFPGSDKNRASFIGVFPISQPKYLVFAIVNDPKGIKETYYYNTGGWVAAPLVKNIIENIIKIFSLPPTSSEDLLKAKKHSFKQNEII
ncbi:MAG: Peptidoglycan synthase FtsI [Alphaproteobacteria bacterium MarineAlpha5_Bin9]|nr:MAG: Peptidoglycan synthase FtsI [Alphaproteobacteria bacterium MarineAlpha5_Bin9]|tara:strand:- start:14265 stop:15902 length:1638 start_codon:yes stop_codon:yes gene_type:complete